MDQGYSKAQKHLSRRDPVLRKLIKMVGPCTLRPDPDGFGVLARAIIAQQISTRAARSIILRVTETLGRQGLSPGAVLKATEPRLRRAGLSESKVRYLRDLAGKCRSGELDFQKLPELADDQVIEHLLPVKGIGRWTAEMFLIFSLGRPDVLPLADHGLRSGVQRHYQMDDLPGTEELMARAGPWQPFRSIATWFIWRSQGEVPQS